MKNIKDIPVFIISWNRLDCLKLLISWLESKNLKNIIIIDNNSTYQPLIHYLKELPYQVHFLKENLGHLALWKSNLFNEIIKKDYFILTDPDVVPVNDCPDDFLEQFFHILKADPKITKVGFSLKIDDIPDEYPLKESVIKHESQFWHDKYSMDEVIYYKAPIDTTFALYRPNIFPEQKNWWESVRTAFPYTARHLSWYIDSDNLTEEDVFYKDAASKTISNWTLNQNNEEIKQKLRIDENYEMFKRPDTNYNIDFSGVVKGILKDEASPLKIISDIVEDNAKILDVGAGNGLLAQVLSEVKKVNIDGIEPNKYAASIAKEHYRNFYCGYVQDYIDVIVKENYDYIVFADVLEHLDDPFNFMKDLVEKLPNNTKILVSLPNIAYGAVRIALLNGNFDYVNSGLLEKTHLRFFTLKTIKELFSKSKLNIDKIFYLQRSYLKTEIRMLKLDFGLNIFNHIQKDKLSNVYQFLLVLSKTSLKTEEKYLGRKISFKDFVQNRLKHYLWKFSENVFK